MLKYSSVFNRCSPAWEASNSSRRTFLQQDSKKNLTKNSTNQPSHQRTQQLGHMGRSNHYCTMKAYRARLMRDRNTKMGFSSCDEKDKTTSSMMTKHATVDLEVL